MKILKWIIIVIAVLIVVLLLIAAFLPSKQHIESSVTVNAPAKAIYEQVIDLKNWEKWSPFNEDDPEMITSYDGAPKGVGAIMSWESKKQGNGAMTITEAENNKSIRTRLDFEGQGSSISDWKFEEDSNKTTKVTWTMEIEDMKYPIGRFMGVMMKSMITKSFEKGLATLQKVSEEYFKILSTFSTTDMQVKQMEKQNALVIKDSSTCDDVESLMGRVYGQLGQFVGMNNIEMGGYPFDICYVWDEKANKFVADIGFITKNKVEGKDNIRYLEIPAQKVVSAIHNGSYETSGETHMAIDKYIKENNLVCIGPPIEYYITDPEKEPDMTRWQTEIVYPVK